VKYVPENLLPNPQTETGLKGGGYTWPAYKPQILWMKIYNSLHHRKQKHWVSGKNFHKGGRTGIQKGHSGLAPSENSGNGSCTKTKL